MAERAEFLNAIGSRSPFAAQARICAAISAFIVDVRFASGSMAAASSRTVFINWISSGRKAAPVVFMAASSPSDLGAAFYVQIFCGSNIQMTLRGDSCCVRCSQQRRAQPLASAHLTFGKNVQTAHLLSKASRRLPRMITDGRHAE